MAEEKGSKSIIPPVKKGESITIIFIGEKIMLFCFPNIQAGP
jgi:hypothetical protein